MSSHHDWVTVGPAGTIAESEAVMDVDGSCSAAHDLTHTHPDTQFAPGLSLHHTPSNSRLSGLPHALPYPHPSSSLPASEAASTSLEYSQTVTLNTPPLSKHDESKVSSRAAICRSPGWEDSVNRKAARKAEKRRSEAEKRFYKEMEKANRRSEREKRKSMVQFDTQTKASDDLQSTTSERSFQARWSQILTPRKAGHRLSKSIPTKLESSPTQVQHADQGQRLTTAPILPTMCTWPSPNQDWPSTQTSNERANEQRKHHSAGNINNSVMDTVESQAQAQHPSIVRSAWPESSPPVSFYQRPLQGSTIRNLVDPSREPVSGSEENRPDISKGARHHQRSNHRSSLLMSASELPRRFLRSTSGTTIPQVVGSQERSSPNDQFQNNLRVETVKQQGPSPRRLQKRRNDSGAQVELSGHSATTSPMLQHPSSSSRAHSPSNISREGQSSSSITGHDPKVPFTIKPPSPINQYNPTEPRSDDKTSIVAIQDARKLSSHSERVPREQLPLCSWDDYVEDVKNGQDLVAIGGIIHDVTEFIEHHPGGQDYISGGIGKDATRLFNGDIHSHSMKAHYALTSLRIGRLAPGWQKRAEETRSANDGIRGGCFRRQTRSPFPSLRHQMVSSFFEGKPESLKPLFEPVPKSSLFITPPLTPSPGSGPPSPLVNAVISRPSDRSLPMVISGHSRSSAALDLHNANEITRILLRDEKLASKSMMESEDRASERGSKATYFDFFPSSSRQSLTEKQREQRTTESRRTSGDAVVNEILEGTGTKSVSASSERLRTVPDIHSHPAPDATLEDGVLLHDVSRLRDGRVTASSASNSVCLPSVVPSRRRLAKLFVTCCQCRRWHDVPSQLYQQMTNPQVEVLSGGGQVMQHINSESWESNRAVGIAGLGEGLKSQPPVVPWPVDECVTSGPCKDSIWAVPPTSDYHMEKEPRAHHDLKCPWCQHPMSKNCCAAWLCKVKLHQRFH